MKYGAPDMIRTCDRWYRKPVLYPAELRAHTISYLRGRNYSSNNLEHSKTTTICLFYL